MKVVHLSDKPKVEVTVDGALKACRQLVISKADGTPSFSVRVFTIKPGGHTPFHVHPFEHINYIIQGTGCLVSRKGKKTPLRKGHFALVLPDEKHQYRNTSRTRSLVLICAVPSHYE